MSDLGVLLFDVFGTLVDWRGSLIAAGEEITERTGVEAEWAAVVDDWRRAYPGAMATVANGADWCDLDTLQRATLGEVLARHDVKLPDEERETLVLGWRRLKPWPDTAAGLNRLRHDYVTATLSNGHVALLVDLLRFGDLRVDAVLSAELARSYKPEPVVYLTALRLLDVKPEEAGMVAAHPSDLSAAAALGLCPIYVRRPLEWGPQAPPTADPDLDGVIIADDLVDLASRLASQ